MNDLHDITFLIATRIYSIEQNQNLKALIKLLLRDYKTHVIVLEADNQPRFVPPKNIDYYFIYDFDVVFHKPMYVNRLLNSANTPYVGVWNESAIGTPKQVVETLTFLRNSSSILAYPYSGKVYFANKESSDNFHQNLKYDTLTTKTHEMSSKNYFFPGDAYFLNKAQYLSLGGENIYFYGTNLDDEARLKRVELLDNQIYFAHYPLYKLWHPQNENKIIPKKAEIANLKELIRICQTN